MQIDFNNVKKQFEKSMDVYEKNALIQNIIADMMIGELLKISDNFENIMELGCGTGLLTGKIAKNLKYKRFFGNDLVEKSQNYIKKYISDASFLCGNALEILPPCKMNLIISNAMFQWFDNLESGINKISGNLENDGLLAFSTFSPDNFKQLNDVTGLTLNYKTKEEIEIILKNLGLRVLYCESFCKVMEFNNPLELLAHLKNTGVNSLSETTWTIKKIKEFCDKFSKKYPKTLLTYSPIIVIAQKTD